MDKNIGLKIWSSNLNYLKPAADLYMRGVYEFIELYAVPGTFKTSAREWKALNIPIRIHAPHEINLAIDEHQKENLELSNELGEFCTALDAPSVVVHPGMYGHIDVVYKQFPMFKKRLATLAKAKILIENMPYRSVDDRFCQGALIEEILKIIDENNIGFCFDICHASKAAIYLKKEIKEFVEQFISLKPDVIHLSDGNLNHPYDQHLSVGQGEFDFGWIASVVEKTGCKNLVLEMQKQSSENLDSFRDDALRVKDLFNSKVKQAR